jgi:hypothetical protein
VTVRREVDEAERGRAEQQIDPVDVQEHDHGNEPDRQRAATEADA